MQYKKWINVFILVSVILSFSVPVLAVPATVEDEKTAQILTFEKDKAQSFEITYNEYEMLESLAKIDTETLKSIGYETEEINQIKNYKEGFKEHIKKVNKTFSDEELLILGYNSEEIKIIRNYSNYGGNDSALAANLTVYLTAPNGLKYNQSNNLNEINLKCRFNRTKNPYFQFTDKLGVTWSHPFVVNTTTHPNGYAPLNLKYAPLSYNTTEWGFKPHSVVL